MQNMQVFEILLTTGPAPDDKGKESKQAESQDRIQPALRSLAA